ncbi:MAG TPA: ABC transporter permease [Opitutus sp.]|nr:ABC transporter permease [Opitutus sp.]
MSVSPPTVARASRPSPFPALARHFLLTLQLNFRSKQAIIYGYLVPVLFLLGFASIFRGDTPPLVGEMGQILTITILGGACFGLPTALVAERERGVWRRYRLLPVRSGALLASTILARLVIIATSVLLQLLLARLIYGTPFPQHPGPFVLAFLVVAFAFLGLGLLVAALADDVPAVQALGQCLFLPMILIGGVGVPLAVLPVWAQRVAGFMPGRYAVESLQRTIAGDSPLAGAGFNGAALLLIGLAAAAIGLKLFRWETARRLRSPERTWIAAALVAWFAVGGAAAYTGRLKPVAPLDAAYAQITDAQIDAITYNDLPGDNELVTRLAPPFDRAAATRARPLLAGLHAWPPGNVADPGECVRHYIALATVADIVADPREAEIARAVFDELQSRFDPATLRRALAWIVLAPDDGTIVQKAPELDLHRHPPERLIRQRLPLYAKKFLGRLVGKIRD